MGFLKNYVANMGQIAKKLGKSSIYGAALKLCSLLVTLLKASTVMGNERELFRVKLKQRLS